MQRHCNTNVLKSQGSLKPDPGNDYDGHISISENLVSWLDAALTSPDEPPEIVGLDFLQTLRALPRIATALEKIADHLGNLQDIAERLNDIKEALEDDSIVEGGYVDEVVALPTSQSFKRKRNGGIKVEIVKD